MKSGQTAAFLVFKTEIGRKAISSQRYRMVLSAALGFVLNLLVAFYHCVLGILNSSLWFIAMCAFYGIFATMRFSAVLCGRREHLASSIDTEYFVMKFSGILLAVLSLVLALVIYISLSQNIAARYDEIVMITIATYTFIKITMAVVRAVKQRDHTSPLLRVICYIGYAEAAASVLTLQRSMLVSFGSMRDEQRHMMNELTGAFVCLFVLFLGISMTVQGAKKGAYGMPTSKIIKANEVILKKVVGTFEKIEDTVVGGYTKIEDAFVDRYLTKEGETVGEAKERLKQKQSEL